jgi:hypothetical protein
MRTTNKLSYEFISFSTILKSFIPDSFRSATVWIISDSLLLFALTTKIISSIFFAMLAVSLREHREAES